MPSPSRYQRETFWHVLEYLEERVDPETRSVQLYATDFAKAVGIHERTLYRYLTDAENFGLIDRKRVATDFVAGRQPNVYTMKVRLADIRERWDEIVHQGPPGPSTADPDLPPSVLPPPPAVRAAVAADVQAVIDELEAGNEDIEIDGWLAGA